MFLRLFVTYLVLVVLAVAAVGVVVLRRADGMELIRDLAGEVIPAAVALTLLAVLPAYLMARRLTRPLKELTAGTRRIADGDFVHKFPVAGSGELTDLARTFNDMTDRLAGTFEQLDRYTLEAGLIRILQTIAIAVKPDVVAQRIDNHRRDPIAEVLIDPVLAGRKR